MRTGLLAEKIGMTQIFDKDGKQIPCTVLKIDEHVVLGSVKHPSGKQKLQLATGDIKENKLNKARKGFFEKLKLKPKRIVKEFEVDDAGILEPKTSLDVTHFVEGQYVDAVATSIGKGFSGVIKRWNFRSQRASHGVSLTHNQAGSTGQCQDPGRVFKGKKMSGQYGNKRVTIQNLLIIKVDQARGILYVKGSVPGADGGQVMLSDAIKYEGRQPVELSKPTQVATAA